MTSPSLEELRASLEQILKVAQGADKKPSGNFSTKIEPVIYGAGKDINFANYNGGAVVQAIAQDLEEFGQKGVQGVRVANDTPFVNKYKARKDLKDPYLQAGVVKGSLVLVLRDDETSVEKMHVLVKDYVKLKEKLKKNTASVTNISPHPDDIISRSVQRTANKLGTTVDNDPNFGEITGNIVLTAHGRPAVMPSGRVVGDALGRKTPAEIFAMLTTNKDPKKRVRKDYDGTLTLCGCFTASGGPEGEKQDDPFAKKVFDLFRENGYKKISVVGYPGAAITAGGPGTDSQGTSVVEGDEMVEAAQATGKDRARAKELEEAAKKALETQKDIYNKWAAQKEKRDKEKAGSKKYKALDKKLEEIADEWRVAKGEADKAKKDLEDSGLNTTWARLEGRFGLRVIN